MIHSLNTQNIGPFPNMEITFGDRLNIITGDNGLGKSFLLDIIWWALTRKWPRDVNRRLTQGYMARPNRKQVGKIEFFLTTNAQTPVAYSSTFDYSGQAWTGRPGRPHNPGLVLYAMADGSFAVWDSARNYWKKKGNMDIQDRPPAYVFSPAEVWDGLAVDSAQLCNGLIRDWASWQKEGQEPYKALEELLSRLSPPGEPLAPGDLTRISLDDVRDMPTVRMAYGEEPVPLVFASSAIRRVLALAYLLVWSIEEHKQASELLNQPPANYVTFLIDEIEAHLHPQWQRSLVPSLLTAMSELMKTSVVQIIMTTHSPLVLSSLENVFDSSGSKDVWFDINLVNGAAEITHRPFEKQGSTANWLTSAAFDLPSDYSLPKEKLWQKLDAAAHNENLSESEAHELEQEMHEILPDIDPLWIRWRKFMRSKGWDA